MGFLCQQTIERCRKAFDKVDGNHNGFIEVEDLKVMYRDLGMQVNELDIRNLIASADLDGNGVLSFDEFVKLVEAGGHCNTQAESDYDTLMAFMTMGGGEDMSGFVDATRLRQVVKDFDLTIDIDNLCKTIDINGDGRISYAEFQAILTGPASPMKPKGRGPTVSVNPDGDMIVVHPDQHFGLHPLSDSFSPFEPQTIKVMGGRSKRDADEENNA